jgi:BlaI family transcriptional regulator, penicillinase repressor
MNKNEKLTRLELELMDTFWDKGECSIRELHEALPEERRPAYTTVQTIVGRLEEKGSLRRTRKIGNAFLYEPAVSRVSAQRRLIDDFLKLFGGSTVPLMAHLVESGRLSLSDLREAEKALEALERQRCGGKK